MPEITSPIPVTTGVRHSERARWLVFAVIVAADLLDMIDSTVTTIAAPTIVRDLGGSDALVPWLGLSYALALGSLLVVGGRLGDRFGQRRTFLIGLIGFTAASLLCGIAWTPAALVVFRLVQGAFGALLIPQGFSILLRTFPRDQLGRVFGLFGPLLAIGAIGGPVLAGLLIHADLAGTGWRSIFLINGLIGTALLITGPRVLPRNTPDATVRVIDPPRPRPSSSSACAPSGRADRRLRLPDWGPVPLICPGRGERRPGRVVRRAATPVPHAAAHAEPVPYPQLRRWDHRRHRLLRRGYRRAEVVSLHLQQGAGLTPFQAAGIMAPLSLGIILTSFRVRDQVQRLGRRLVLAGTTITLLGVLGRLAVVLAAPGLPVLLAIPLFITGLGMGCCFGSLFSTALGDVGEHEAGSASGTLNALQQIANATGAALVSTLFVALAATSTDTTAVTVSLLVVAVILAVAAAITPMLPRHAAAEPLRDATPERPQTTVCALDHKRRRRNRSMHHFREDDSLEVAGGVHGRAGRDDLVSMAGG